MAKGINVLCTEEAEIVNFGITFEKDHSYLLVKQGEDIYVVDHKHNPVKFNSQDILNKHFKKI